VTEDDIDLNLNPTYNPDPPVEVEVYFLQENVKDKGLKAGDIVLVNKDELVILPSEIAGLDANYFELLAVQGDVI
jgi:hypothetical protein